ncbi:MAG: hypothetical protein HKN87_10660 [Saprospiraceae bacterium]|nr:hypothetical protein [Saprospiraceae bacterium]
MIESMVVGIGVIVLLMLGWIAVQHWWGRVFADYVTDEDVMAGRTKCSNCGCTTACELKQKQFSES